MSKKQADTNPAEAKAEDKPVVHIAEKGVIAAGLKLAQTFNTAAKTQRNATLSCAEMLKDKSEDDLNDFLRAFREGIGIASASATSSKVKAVILAYRVKDFKRVAGIDEATKEVKYETKSGKEWLESHHGTFENLCTLAREVRGKQEGQGSSGGKPTAKTTLNDATMGKIEDNVKLATSNQAQEILARATDQLQSANPKGWEVFLVSQIADCCKRLSVPAAGLVFQKLAQDIQGLVNDHHAQRDAFSKEVLAAKEVINEPAGKPNMADCLIGPPTPAPAFDLDFTVPANIGQPFQFQQQLAA